jgi:hypothetical protein
VAGMGRKQTLRLLWEWVATVDTNSHPTLRIRRRTHLASEERTRSTRAPRGPVASHSEFGLKKALFEIAIVTVGVLLALGVDQLRQSWSDRMLLNETRSALRTEVDNNRIRLVTKLAKVHQAYLALEADPTAGPALVEHRADYQIELAETAWTMAQQTGALRLMGPKERQAFATTYASHDIYNRILAEEMNHWADLSASRQGDRSTTLWKAYALRVAGGACISLMRIERYGHPEVPLARLQQGCAGYTPRMPPEAIYQRFGLPMPRTRWQPGSDF